MTTGRINQVTISVCTHELAMRTAPVLASRDTFHGGRSLQGFKFAFVNSPTVTDRIPSEDVLSEFVTSRRNTLYPDLTSFKQALLVQRTKITAFSEDYQQPAAPEKMRAVTAYLRLV